MQPDNRAVSTVRELAKRGTEACFPNRWGWVEASVWTECMLAALDNGVKGGRWYSLIDKVYARSTLNLAWKKVASNKGAAGVDHVSIDRFRSREGYYLDELERSLRSGTYRPYAVKRMYIPKGGGKFRPLGIPVVKDRIVQTALKMVLEPIFEKDFLSMSFGFRPGRGCKDALREVDALVKSGHTWYVDADLKSYFDTISHEGLIRRLSEKVSDGSVLQIVELFLRQEIMEGIKRWTPVSGTPQGAVLSPLLSNIYLHPMDNFITDRGHRMVRYADDFVILCRSREEAMSAFNRVKEWVLTNGLELNLDKTHIGNCANPGEGFEFLGYLFEQGRRYVRRKSLKNLREKIRQKTKRTCGRNVRKVIEDLNPMLKGWFEYFKHAHEYTFSSVDGFVRRRLRAIKRKQEKRPGRGKCLSDHMRWPNAYFANLGLFTMKEAHLRACQSR